MRRLIVVSLAASLLAACAAPGTASSPSTSTALSPSPLVSLPPSSIPAPASPIPAATRAPKPTPTPKPVTGWPSVSREGITMTGAGELDAGDMDGRLRLSVTMTGLKPGQAVSLTATGKYAVRWVCGVEPEPCGEIGCGPTFWGDSEGTAKRTAKAVAGKDGTAVFRIKLPAVPPAKTCPTDPTAPWSTMEETWKNVRITDPVHGLRLAPGTISYGDTF